MKEDEKGRLFRFLQSQGKFRFSLTCCELDKFLLLVQADKEAVPQWWRALGLRAAGGSRWWKLDIQSPAQKRWLDFLKNVNVLRSLLCRILCFYHWFPFMIFGKLHKEFLFLYWNPVSLLSLSKRALPARFSMRVCSSRKDKIAVICPQHFLPHQTHVTCAKFNGRPPSQKESSALTTIWWRLGHRALFWNSALGKLWKSWVSLLASLRRLTNYMSLN